MTIYTKADADAAQAIIDADNVTLLANEQAVVDATNALVAANSALADASAALDAATASVEAVKEDIAVNQAVVDAYTAQEASRLPDMPEEPIGPFVHHSSMKVTTGAPLSFSNTDFGAAYIAINYANNTLFLESLELQDVVGQPGLGTLFYAHGNCNGGTVKIGRVSSPKNLRGRQFLQFSGSWDTIDIDDLTVIYDPTPNTMTGNIATGIQLGNKAAGEVINSCHIKRARVENIYCGNNGLTGTAFHGWSSSKYWNGDGLTSERNCLLFTVDNFYGKNITDGGIDSKARKNVFGKVYVENARAALKLWDDTICNQLTSVNPVQQGGKGGCSHLRLMGSTDGRVREYVFPDVIATGAAPLFHVENGPVKITASGTYDGATLLVKASGGSVTADSTWNGQPIK